jgi:hypothetical protein
MLTRRLARLALLCICALSAVSARALSVAPVTQVLPAATGPITFPSTAIGGTASNVVAVSLLINQAGTLTITAPASANGHVEFTVGAITGCTADGVTTVAAASTCNFNVTFAPYYPGQRSQPLVVTLGGQVYTFGMTGTATGPLTHLDPSYLATLAGNAGSSASATNLSPATNAASIFYTPEGMTADSSNNVYVADAGDYAVRVVYQAANPQLACLIITENPASFGNPTNGCVGATSQPQTGNVYTIAGHYNTPTTQTSGVLATSNYIALPAGVAVDPAGNIYIADQNNYKLFMIYQGGANAACLVELENPTIFGTTGLTTCAAAAAATTSQPIPGYMYLIGGTGTGSYSGDSGLATAAKIDNPAAIAVDAAGDVFFSHFTTNVTTPTVTDRIRVIYNGGAAAAQLIALENGGITPVVGDMYTVAGNTAAIYTEAADNQLASSTTAGMLTCYSLTLDQYDNVYFADKTYSTGVPLATDHVRVIYNAGAATVGNPLATLITLENPAVTTPTAGYVYTLAGFPATGSSSTTAGMGYKPSSTAGTSAGTGITGYSITNGVATITLNGTPTALNAGTSAGLVVGSQVTIAGLTSTVGATLNGTDITVTGYSSSTPNQFQIATTTANIAQTTEAGTLTYPIYPQDGVLATSSQLALTYGIALDAAGDILISDRYNFTIRRVSANTGKISTIAGQPAAANTIATGYALGGVGRLYAPWNIAADSGGGVYIVDYGANRIRFISSTESSSYPMTVPTGAANANSPINNYIATNVGTLGSTLTLTSDATASPFGFLSPVPTQYFSSIGECQTSSSLATSVTYSSVSLAAGQSCNIGVAMNAPSAGTYTGSAVLTDNSLSIPNSTHTMYLTGTDTGVAIALTSNPASPYAGSPTQLTATLTNGTTPVTAGTVSFYLGTNSSGTLLGSGNLDPVLGTVTITTSALTTGTDNIFINYPGMTTSNPLFVAATTTVPLVVAAKPVPTVTITASPNAISAGQATLLTVTVTPPPSTGTPTGSVIIYTKIGTGTATAITGCSTTTLASNGIFNCSPTTLAQGTNIISATYGGDNTFATASTTTNATVVVTGLPTTTTVTALPANANLNQQVTLTATVSGVLLVPPLTGGAVTFKDTFTPVNSTTPVTLTYGPVAVNSTTDQAVYTSTTFAGGTHVISATFSSDSYYANSTTSTPATFVVVTPSYTVTLVSANGTAVPVTTPATTFAGIAVSQGQNGGLVFSVQTVGGYTGTITPSCDLNGTPVSGLSTVTPLPAGLGCTFTPASFPITANSTSTETVFITTQQLTSSNRMARPLLAVFLLPGAGLALFGLRRRAALKQWQRLALFCLVFVGGAMAMAGISGCGNGVSKTSTPRASYLLPVVFTDGTTTQVFQITVSVTAPIE